MLNLEKNYDSHRIYLPNLVVTEEPVGSPHNFLDSILTDETMEQAIDRINKDRKIIQSVVPKVVPE